MRGLVMLLLCWVPGLCLADALSIADNASASLVIYSSTDERHLAPLIADFQQRNPGVRVHYVEMLADALHQRFVAEADQGRHQADLLLSSAADLQVKLVNDGYALSHRSAETQALPAWARWRDQAFGFTYEPAVMVFNAQLMTVDELPHSRDALLAMMLRQPARFAGRVTTYDIRRSAVGYLLATQDARSSGIAGSLLQTFGAARVELEAETSAMLERIERGDMLMGYNLLGSYAQARADAGAALHIVYPADYTLAVSRTAVIPLQAPHADLARRFLDHLLSARGQAVLSDSRLFPLRPAGGPGDLHDRIHDLQVSRLRPTALGPGLMVYLDAMKRDRFLASWTAAMQPTTPD